MSLLRRRRSERENDQKRTIWRSSVDYVMVCFGKISENIMLLPDQVKVWVALENPIIVPCPSDCTAEDLCIILCAKLQIQPLTRTLFGLRIKGTDHFLADNGHVSSNKHYELRIRFKVPAEQLDVLEKTTYEYYFRQVRHDLFHNAIPEIKYPEHKNNILGFGVTDMWRARLEDNLSIDTIDDSYKKYIPKVIVKNHGQCAQKCAKEFLLKIESSQKNPKINVTKVKREYLDEIYSMAPNYLAEEYRDVQWQSGEESIQVNLQVAPFRGQDSGLRMYHNSKWTHICSIEDLQSFTRSRVVPNGLQISLKRDPYFFKFKSAQQLSSFISVCDGYYRLTVKWTFNLSKDDETPSLKKLSAMKCHGPVGGEFSFQKLEKSEHGAFVLRQCQKAHDDYYLDVCGKNGTKESYRLKYVKDNNEEYYEFNQNKYKDIDKVIETYQDPQNDIYLKRLIPPLEHDKSPLLLCTQPTQARQLIDMSQLDDVLKGRALRSCLAPADIRLYAGTVRKSSSGIMCTTKALWMLDRVKEIEVAYKYLDLIDYSVNLSMLAAKWAKVQSESIVRLYGIVLTSPVAMALEYLPYGPLDSYLRNFSDKKARVQHLRPLNLMRVASTLAGALSTLSDVDVVHGHVRCRRLLLAGFHGDCIVAKLAEPSLRSYTDDDKPWLPPEYYPYTTTDKKGPTQTVEGDIFAFATTVWEIFSYGQAPPLPQVAEKPADVKDDTWQLLRACWQDDPQARPRPQSIMRDMYNALYIDYPIEQSLSILPNLTAQYLNSELLPLLDTVPDQHLLNKGHGPQKPITIQTINTSISTKSSVTHTYDVLGKGNYGIVYLGHIWDDEKEIRVPEKVAIKELHYASENALKDFKNELNIMQAAAHENIVKVLGYWTGVCMMGIVMEYLPHRSLQSYLSWNTDLTAYNFIKYSLDIAEGMRHLSEYNVLHRDLAARNVLVKDQFNVKISDFGLSRRLRAAQNEYQSKASNAVPIHRYAPEAADAGRFSEQSEVWTYGITAWEIFDRCVKPLPSYEKDRTPAEWARFVTRGFPKPAECPDNPDIYECVMRRCWAIDPDNRPTFKELVNLLRDIYAKYQRNQQGTR